MDALVFYLFYGINWLVTLLPLKVLYICSDLLFTVFYYFPGYRRKVVRTNLVNSFPEKSIAEIISIEKKFYHHLGDLLIETLKLTHMSKRSLKKRLHLTNPEILERLYNENRDVVAVLGHYGNWEWLNCLPLYSKLQVVSIYRPLANRYFDRFMINLRSKNGMMVTPMQHIVREIVDNRNRNTRSMYAFVTDQTPPKADIKYWTMFLNQETPVYLGAEKIASKYDMAVVFFSFIKKRRGEYNSTAEILFEHTTGLPEHLITDTHVKRLEKAIRENPELWVWSHRRWKYKRENLNG